jgi:hypothetical protein
MLDKKFGVAFDLPGDKSISFKYEKGNILIEKSSEDVEVPFYFFVCAARVLERHYNNNSDIPLGIESLESLDVAKDDLK